jgi:hypothetical protein
MSWAPNFLLDADCIRYPEKLGIFSEKSTKLRLKNSGADSEFAVLVRLATVGGPNFRVKHRKALACPRTK